MFDLHPRLVFADTLNYLACHARDLEARDPEFRDLETTGFAAPLIETTARYLVRVAVGYGCGGEETFPLLAYSHAPSTEAVKRLVKTLTKNPMAWTRTVRWDDSWPTRRAYEEALKTQELEVKEKWLVDRQTALETVDVLVPVLEQTPYKFPSSEGYLEVFTQEGCRCSHHNRSSGTEGTSKETCLFQIGSLLFTTEKNLEQFPSAALCVIEEYAALIAAWEERQLARETHELTAEQILDLSYEEYETYQQKQREQSSASWQDPYPGWHKFTECFSKHFGATSVWMLSKNSETYVQTDPYTDSDDQPADLLFATRLLTTCLSGGQNNA